MKNRRIKYLYEVDIEAHMDLTKELDYRDIAVIDTKTGIVYTGGVNEGTEFMEQLRYEVEYFLEEEK